MQKLEGMEAVRDRMPLARLAREIGITRGAVAQWKEVPAERIGIVSRVTGIPLERLRPDLFKTAEDAA
ncbi:YdaS family helix-turn-helix protein [Rhizobium sp. S163]|uniref:YdaS family helix-turn-helix protein n=1 Tax=Rhizobium sp. S163 TaxID=3055039 RepID=UPI0025AA24D8|nr:YdaS family helix-turn-helix protein [Rhizobium sp. S163]MDM9643852.1 YdaS family helix-turn-helix protein [Rhizobium sp. S163]